nr:unnamed protein product [Callosobruchus chinensis]
MDSMTSVEIKQTLEREFEIFLSTKDIRGLTLARLKEIESEKFEGKSAENSKSREANQEQAGLEQVLRLLGDMEESKKKEMRLVSRLRDGQKGPTVFFLPGTEGFARVMHGIASRLDAHVIAVQYTHDMKFETIQEMAKNLVPIITKHQKKNELFRLVAYSYGAVVGMELCNILESMGYTGILISLDGSPSTVKSMVSKLVSSTSEHEFHIKICLYMLNFVMPPEAVSKTQDQFENCTTWDEKADLLVSLSKDVVSFDSEYLKEYANVVLKRLRAIINYTPSNMKLKTKVKLFNATRGLGSGDTLPVDFGLSEYCATPVEVEIYDGNHIDIVNDENVAEKVNNIINQQ